MSDQSLRDELEKLVEHWRYKGEDLKAWQEGGGPDPYEAGLDDAATAIRKLLTEPPAEPVGVSDEAVEVVAETFARTSSGGLWGQYTELTRQLVISNAKPTARAALEAAAPLMGATLRPTREQIAEALLVELKRQGADEFFYPGKLADDLAAAVLALMGGAERRVATNMDLPAMSRRAHEAQKQAGE